jgi:type IV secretory pathway TrbF-like protein
MQKRQAAEAWRFTGLQRCLIMILVLRAGAVWHDEKGGWESWPLAA